jgi:formylglycine-generating enzyme required for sulfatase activity
MVTVPAGSFIMGSPISEYGRLVVEGPQHLVAITQPFAVGRFAVTVDQFAAFAEQDGHPMEVSCQHWSCEEWRERVGSFRNPGFAQNGDHPVVCVSWHDARSYAGWISHKTGRPYRLLTEAEWEYVTRAGTTTPFWWGVSIDPGQANYKHDLTYGGAEGQRRDWLQRTVSVASFAANPWGLHQTHGNIWEWVEDGWHDSYAGAPADGTACEARIDGKRVLRGGSWINGPRGLRSARRHAASPNFRRSDVGFRLAMTLTIETDNRVLPSRQHGPAASNEETG